MCPILAPGYIWRPSSISSSAAESAEVIIYFRLAKLTEKPVINLKALIISVTWYPTERGKVRSIPLPLPFCVWNNRPQRQTVKSEIWIKVNSSQPTEQSNEFRSEWRSKATHTPWPIIGWTEKGMQVTLVAWSEEIVGEEKKPNDWPDPLAPKWYLFVRENLEKNL